MSKYTPEILDRSLLALRAEIAQKSGDHKYFPRGYAFEGYSLWTVRPIPGVFIGWTTRFFIYLPPTPENANTGNTSIENLSWERCEMRLAGDRNGSTTIVGMRTAKGQFESVFRGMTSQSEATQPIKTDDLKGANCFSVALRVTNTDSIAVLINLKEVFRGTFDNLQDPNITWEFTFKTGSYSIFSWHTTDELKSSSTHWGNHLSMENFWCPTGTEATITVVALKDSDVENDNTGNTSIENLSRERCEMRLTGYKNGKIRRFGMRAAKRQFESVFRDENSHSDSTQPIKTDDLNGANCFSVALQVTNTDSIAVLINLKEVFRGTLDNVIGFAVKKWHFYKS